MTASRLEFPTIVVLALGLIASGGFADSLGSLPDPRYWDLTDDPLSGPIDGPIDRIVYPTIGFPSIVAHGDTLTVLFRHEASGSTRFRVELSRTRGPVRDRYRLPVRQVVREDWGGSRLTVDLSRTVPPDMYDLAVTETVAGVSGTAVNIVRVLEVVPDRFRFVHIADSQHGDPRGVRNPANLNDGSLGAGSFGPVEILRQELEEIRFLDPTFCVLSGDLLYGINYEAEYSGAYQEWKTAGFPVFMVPGNHDGYATTREYRFLSLRVGRTDGLEHWRRTFGPLYYSFDFGRYHFVALNSYDGSPQRRDAIYATAMNYGGHLDPAQLAWFRRDISAATAAGRQSIIFMHHSPRGTLRRNGPSVYVPNQPFTVANVADELFRLLSTGKRKRSAQTWNDEASAREFFDIIEGSSVSHVLLGHSHRDRVTKVGGVEFIETTTLSSSANQYWGYRIFEVDGPRFGRVDYEGSDRQSIPAGNLRFEERDADGRSRRASVTIHNGLSRPVDGVVDLCLRWSDAGFRVTGGTLRRARRVGSEAIVTVEVDCRAGSSFTAPSRTVVEVEAIGAKPPAPMPGCSSSARGPGRNGSGSTSSSAAVGTIFWFLVAPLVVCWRGRRSKAAA